MIQSKIQTVTHNIWLIIIRKSFRGDILYCLIELFFLSVISALILKKTEDNSLFGVKLLIHHWTSNLHDADYQSTTMKARIQTWSIERDQSNNFYVTDCIFDLMLINMWFFLKFEWSLANISNLLLAKLSITNIDGADHQPLIKTLTLKISRSRYWLCGDSDANQNYT